AHRAVLKDSGVVMLPGVAYERVDDAGLHIRVAAADGQGDSPGETRVLEVDHVVVCAGQESVRGLYDDLLAAGVSAHLVGGADVAAELDAKRAIKQGTELAATL
ncbi:MAG: NADPH-dependent 2,4-dienoyl-CoA reductase, partial [Nocardioides sp.]